MNTAAANHKLQATQLLAQGRSEAALAEYRAALALAPDDLFARRKAADLLLELGLADQAIAEYEGLARRHASEGHAVQAIALCKLIHQLAPGRAPALETVAHQFAARPPSPAEPEPRPAADRAPAPPEASRAPFFSEFPQEIFVALLQNVELQSFSEGDVILREGEQGRSMFLVAHGTVTIQRELPGKPPRLLAVQGPGSFFGEMALVADVPRLATAIAREECVLVEVTRPMIERLTGQYPALAPAVMRSFKERLLANLMRAGPVFAAFGAQEKRELVDAFELFSVPENTTLLKQGGCGHSLFVLLRGRCEVFDEAEDGTRVAYPELSEGSIFGEISLLNDCPVTATVQTAAPCLLVRLDRERFQARVLANPAATALLQRLSKERIARTEQLHASEAEIVIELEELV